jgi:Ca-activated chloride channel family protein
MQRHDAVKRGSRVASALGALLLTCAAFAWCQSVGDVHIEPRKMANDSAALTKPAEGVLSTNSRPFQAVVDVVLVPVVVTDGLNRPVLDLNKQDFTLLENGKPQEIRYFSREQAPISIALLLDVSKSMSNKVDAEQAAIAEFVKNANPDDEYFAIAFSDRPRLLAESTQSVDEVERRLLSAERGGATAMLDAIYMAESKLRSARYKRRAIVIISDGGDNASRYTLHEIKQLVRESDVQIYAIGLFDSFFHTVEEKLGKQWLSEITDDSGGRTVTVNNQAKLPQAAAAVSWEMRNEYVMGYTTTSSGKGSWRTIKVRLASSANSRRLTIHHRKGYYALGMPAGEP